MQRSLMRIGALLAVFGLLAGVGSIVLPWALHAAPVRVGRRVGAQVQKITVLNLEGGLWYVVLLLTLVALLGAAVLGANQARKIAGVAGPVLALVDAALAVGLIGVAGRTGSTNDAVVGVGAWLALVALAALGLACGLLAIGRARVNRPTSVGGRVSAGGSVPGGGNGGTYRTAGWARS